MKTPVRHVGFLILILSSIHSMGQTIDLNYPTALDYLRRIQLDTGSVNQFSFTARAYDVRFVQDSLLNDYFSPHELVSQKHFKLSLLPIHLNANYNSHHPYGWNNGPMAFSRGLQTATSWGINLKVSLLSINLAPSMLFIQNQDYQGLPDTHPDAVWNERYRVWNSADLAERYADEPTLEILPGNSRVSIDYGAFSMGVSTENLWWGPGRHNSLVMSNNPRGFGHLTLNTQKAAKTIIGSFEGQIIVGRLNNKKHDELPYPERHKKNPWVFEKKDQWRYLNGITITYQPRWIPGFYLGANRVIQNYYDSTKTQKSYFPVLDNFYREKDQNQHDDGSKDQILSGFARWVFARAQAEVYVEFGRSDASWNFRDLLMSPEHSRAYLAGFTKLIDLPQDNQKIEVSMETTHMERSKTSTLRAEPTWYTNAELRHGYTHRGEVLGAGIGPGSNSQNLSVSWVNQLKKIGLSFERLVNDNDFYMRTFDPAAPYGGWVDTSLGFLYAWNWDHMVLDSKLQLIHSDNYQWESGKSQKNMYLSVRTIYAF